MCNDNTDLVEDFYDDYCPDCGEAWEDCECDD